MKVQAQKVLDKKIYSDTVDANRSRTETQEGSSSETQIELHYGVVTELHFLSYQRKAARSETIGNIHQSNPTEIS